MATIAQKARTVVKKAKGTPEFCSPENAVVAIRQAYKAATNRDLEDDIAATPGTTLEKKKTQAERKRHLRNITREVKNKLEEEWKKGAMDTCLQERVSFSSCKRQRERTGFESPEAKRRRAEVTRLKSHSPTTITWDATQVLAAAKNWPADKVINWSAFARLHGVPGKNCGQLVKEYLGKQGIDVLTMEG